MLKQLIENGFGKDEDLNCAEKILYGANEVYKLGLDKEALKLAAGFGGGMAIEGTCGALTGSIMVLSKLFVKNVAHESDRIKKLTTELLNAYESEMGNINCKPLKENYRSPSFGCHKVILKAAEALDKIVQRELEIQN
ncbi:C-GCAxxG-C-C family (seleno)protein [Maledivibacter halophilus]|uniref:C_GCAxxG_C_C family probable redox protein n=1 Tax=Maledivibacter halophilus TaxID=36842 RepID=A0A1T5M7L8_9FIRM|nr:C-GCAxxG-C-C family (seleno)protein [Maledivibacter halophilus]SKC84236.1 C_GCAxxG_C_C family probable redox protein [Maledivibacter halophilus]